jgi:hypothetical protein
MAPPSIAKKVAIGLLKGILDQTEEDKVSVVIAYLETYATHWRLHHFPAPQVAGPSAQPSCPKCGGKIASGINLPGNSLVAKCWDCEYSVISAWLPDFAQFFRGTPEVNITGEQFLARRGFADSRNYSSTQLGPLLEEYARGGVPAETPSSPYESRLRRITSDMLLAASCVSEDSAEEMALAVLRSELSGLLEKLRQDGWMVAVHNTPAQPAAEGSADQRRCQSLHPYNKKIQCELPDGHKTVDGSHLRGEFIWHESTGATQPTEGETK